MPTPGSIPAPDLAPTRVDRATLLARLLPEALSLATALAIGFGAFPAGSDGGPLEIIGWAVMVEAVTVMFLCTVIDIATRLRRPPPWWGGILLAAALFALYPEVPRLLLAAFREGLWIALPFAWSLLERLRELWTLPGQPVLERLRRRTLTFGRLYTGLVVAAVAAFTGVAAALGGGMDVLGAFIVAATPWFVAAFFALCAWDVVRVHRPAFAARPVSLWPRIDGGQSADLSPL